MGKNLLIFSAFLLFSAYILFPVFKDEVAPEFPDFYWGPSINRSLEEDKSIQPFLINVSDQVISDLNTRLTMETRLDKNRLVAPLEGTAFEYGFNNKILANITEYWLKNYDWRTRETLLNAYPHFKTRIAGISVHFQQIRQNTSNTSRMTIPLLMLHGWPESFATHQKIVAFLNNLEKTKFTFELIIPSLPGFGFSEGSHIRGLGPVGMSQIFLKLMQRLGHQKFYIQAGDWGAVVANHMAAIYPESVKGIYLNMCYSLHPKSIIRVLVASIKPNWFMDDDRVHALYPLLTVASTLLRETGYFHLQATRPDSLGIGMSHSPSALAGYVLEKFLVGTNLNWLEEENGGLLSHYSIDELLDNLMIYWVTNSFTTSARLYKEAFEDYMAWFKIEKIPIFAPTGCYQGPHELLSPQTGWMLQDRYRNLVSFTKGDKGGHMAAFEVPRLLSEDLINYFRKIKLTPA